jgi:hypothetical protein
MRALLFLAVCVAAVCIPIYVCNDKDVGTVPSQSGGDTAKNTPSFADDLATLGRKILFSFSSGQQPQAAANPAPASVPQLYDNGKLYIEVYEPGFGTKYIRNPYNPYWKTHY